MDSKFCKSLHINFMAQSCMFRGVCKFGSVVALDLTFDASDKTLSFT